MKAMLEKEIEAFVKAYQEKPATVSSWKKPIVGYASAKDTMFVELKEIVSPTHALPQDFLENAETVIAYFLPFDESIVKSNWAGRSSSVEWGQSYIETNNLIVELNTFIKNLLEEKGYQATLIPTAHHFTPKTLISDWSQRHVGYVAGLGKFGLNRMLITEKGCCGRIGSIVTNLRIKPTERKQDESCFYKANGSCKKCANKCVNEALFENEAQFDRNKCYEMCLYNVENLKDIGYTDVCGKCLVEVPCSFIDPVSKLKKGRALSNEESLK